MDSSWGRSRREALTALTALLVTARTARSEPQPSKLVSIVPLGAVSDLEVGIVTRALLAFYALEVKAVDRRALPQAAYYPKRGRYRAERLLQDLERRAEPSSLRVLGLASVDISTTKGNIEDWGILGLATIDGRVGVLSSFRCRRLAHSADQVAHRLGKTAVHELGHTFGLDHCPNAGCLMRDGHGSVLTSDQDYDLCPSCRGKLATHDLLVNPAREPPWPRPAKNA